MENLILPLNNYTVHIPYNTNDIIDRNISDQNLRNEIKNNLHPIHNECEMVYKDLKVIFGIVFEILSNHYTSLQNDWKDTIGFKYIQNLKYYLLDYNDNSGHWLNPEYILNPDHKRSGLLNKYGFEYDIEKNCFVVSAGKTKSNFSLEDRITFYLLENYSRILKYNIRSVYSKLYKETSGKTSEPINVLNRAESISTMTNSLVSCNRVRDISKNLMGSLNTLYTNLRSNLILRSNKISNPNIYAYVIRGRKYKPGTKIKLVKQSSYFGKSNKKTPEEIGFQIVNPDGTLDGVVSFIAISNIAFQKF